MRPSIALIFLAACGGAPFTELPAELAPDASPEAALAWTEDAGLDHQETDAPSAAEDHVGVHPEDGAPAADARADAGPLADADAGPPPPPVDAGHDEPAPPPPAVCCTLTSTCSSRVVACASSTCYCGQYASACSMAYLGEACWLNNGCPNGVLGVCP